MTRMWLIGLYISSILSLGVESDAFSQGTGPHSIERLLPRFERGDYGRLDEILERAEEALPVLVGRLKHRQASARLTAVDLLARIDLSNDGLINNDAVIQAFTSVLDGSETNEEVVDHVLRQLDRLDPRKSSAQLSQPLVLQLQRGRARAIRILGRLGDPALIPILEPYASKGRGVGDLAKQAMAKLGDQRYLSEILAELDVDGVTRSRALEKLGYVAARSTVQEIAKFLYDSGVPPSEIGPMDRVGYLPYRHTAAWALGQIVDNPPVKKELGLLTENDIKTWKTWWEANKGNY